MDVHFGPARLGDFPPRGASTLIPSIGRTISGSHVTTDGSLEELLAVRRQYRRRPQEICASLATPDLYI
jgi:hypothetical protein